MIMAGSRQLWDLRRCPLIVRFLHGEPISTVDTGVGIYTKENIAEVKAK